MSAPELSGAALAEAVAVEVMGWRVHPRNTAHWMKADADQIEYGIMGFTCGYDAFRPDGDIKAAWQVVERMHCPRIEDLWSAPAADRWRVTCGPAVGYGETAPEAICRCALLLVRAAGGREG